MPWQPGLSLEVWIHPELSMESRHPLEGDHGFRMAQAADLIPGAQMGQILHQQPAGLAVLAGEDDGPVVLQPRREVSVNAHLASEGIVQMTQSMEVPVGRLTFEHESDRCTAWRIAGEMKLPGGGLKPPARTHRLDVHSKNGCTQYFTDPPWIRSLDRWNVQSGSAIRAQRVANAAMGSI